MTAQPRFNLSPGRVITKNYRVDRLLGSGYEGEVYLVTERLTGASRAAKLFYPERNLKDKAAIHYARTLEKLRDCAIVIKYHHAESIRLQGESVSVLISEYVEGQLLPEHAKQYPGSRIPTFAALHLLHTIAKGLAEIHDKNEYHGDLHPANILVRRRGIHFDVKLVDLYDRGRTTKHEIKEDVCDIIRAFYDILGGQRHYAKQPDIVKSICLGLKRTRIHERFPTAHHLYRHLETYDW